MTTITGNPQQGFPKIAAPFVNDDGTINQVWLQLLITLWNRTGGAPGENVEDVLVLALAQPEDPGLALLSHQSDFLLSPAVSGLIQSAVDKAVDQASLLAIPSPFQTADAALALAFGGVQVEWDAGVYTPTLTNVANLDASTAYQCQWLRIHNVISVSGRVDVDPTAAASTKLGISLPRPSSFLASNNCAGAAAASAIAGQSAAILGDVTNARAQLEWIAVDLTNQPMWFSFSYLVI